MRQWGNGQWAMGHRCHAGICLPKRECEVVCWPWAHAVLGSAVTVFPSKLRRHNRPTTYHSLPMAPKRSRAASQPRPPGQIPLGQMLEAMRASSWGLLLVVVSLLLSV
eukprot:2882657-Pyramimonas_sp.AAC.1